MMGSGQLVRCAARNRNNPDNRNDNNGFRVASSSCWQPEVVESEAWFIPERAFRLQAERLQAQVLALGQRCPTQGRLQTAAPVAPLAAGQR